ncbi:MAG: tetratricopeptide repeat protein [Candidatus Korobacteraceae bacterium]
MLLPQAQIRTVAVVLLGTVICFVAAAKGAAQVASEGHRRDAPATAAQAAATMSDRQACMILKSVLPTLNTYPPVHYTRFNKDGITRIGGKHDEKSSSFSYSEIKKVDSPNVDHPNIPNVYIFVDAGKNGRHEFKASNTEVVLHGALMARLALLQFSQEAHDGHTIYCSDDAKDYASELADFQEKTATWRALTTKPAISEEVYKDRLLAEDALKSKDLNDAALHYEAGVTSDPTWAQGWYNVALVYAELQDYFDAAECMKHYVILVPDAQDARAAKDNIILWEAKAPHAANDAR